MRTANADDAADAWAQFAGVGQQAGVDGPGAVADQVDGVRRAGGLADGAL